jgi:hypothetical protein
MLIGRYRVLNPGPLSRRPDKSPTTPRSDTDELLTDSRLKIGYFEKKFIEPFLRNRPIVQFSWLRSKFCQFWHIFKLNLTQFSLIVSENRIKILFQSVYIFHYGSKSWNFGQTSFLSKMNYKNLKWIIYFYKKREEKVILERNNFTFRPNFRLFDP